MKILLTGSTGFIGSCLAPQLRDMGYDVVEMVRYIAGGRFNFYGRNDVMFADLRDRETVQDVVLRVSPDMVINLAAQSAVSYSFVNPSDVAATNYQGVIALAEAARRCDRLKLFIQASTSEVYGRTTVHPTPETAPIGATSPYASSKIAAEEYLRTLHGSYGFPVLIMRPFNTYGRGLVGNKHFVVERAITQALEEGRIELHDPRPYREFLFREDHVNGYLCAVDACERSLNLAGETINLALGRSYQISEMAEMVASIVGNLTHTTVPVTFSAHPDRPMDIPRLEGNGTRAKALLGWEPKWGLADGLRQAVREWQLSLSK